MTKFNNLKFRLQICLTLIIAFIASAQINAQILSSYCDGDPSDWANFQQVYPIHGYKLDPANAVSNSDDQFTQGSKDGDQISSWHWSFGSANAKGDITNAAAALVNGCVLRFAADRTSDNGDASIGFWFFKNPVIRLDNGSFSGSHTNGDLLILSDFTTGGTIPTITIYEWNNGQLVLQNSSSNACANVNHSTAAVPAGFTYVSANGSTQYAPNLFFEGAIDLCKLNLPTCFSYFLVETRNSQSITASLQDFAANSFNATPPAPQANITQPTCTVRTGTITVISPTGSGYTYSIDGINFQSSTTFNNVNPGAYTLTVNTPSNCSNSSQVTVNAAPAIPANPVAAVTQPSCSVATGTITVTSPTGSGYSYSLDGVNFQTSITFSNVGPGNYTLTVKNSDGCIAISSVTVNAQPVTPDRPVVTLQEATICGTNATPTVTVSCPILGTYTLKQTGQANQTFSFNGSNGPVIFSIKPGLGGFSITVTNTSGCTSAATDCSNYTSNSCPPQTVAAPRTTDLTETVENIVSAAPNPFNDQIRFYIKPAVSGQSTLELYTILGQKVKTVYHGFMQKGQTQSIQYSVPYSQRSNLIYIFRVGPYKTSGKLINLKQ